MTLNFPLFAGSEACGPDTLFRDAESFFRTLCDLPCDCRYRDDYGYYEIVVERFGKKHVWTSERTEEAAWQSAAEDLCQSRVILVDDADSLRDVIASLEEDGDDATEFRAKLAQLEALA